MFDFKTFEGNEKVGIKIAAVLVGIVLIYMFIIYPLQKGTLIKKGKYTVGEIIKIIDRKDAYDPVYKYKVKGITYSSSESRMVQGVYNFSPDYIGRRYFVLFDSTKPARACLLPLNPVPDSFKDMPYFGWEKIP